MTFEELDRLAADLELEDVRGPLLERVGGPAQRVYDALHLAIGRAGPDVVADRYATRGTDAFSHVLIDALAHSLAGHSWLDPRLRNSSVVPCFLQPEAEAEADGQPGGGGVTGEGPLERLLAGLSATARLLERAFASPGQRAQPRPPPSWEAPGPFLDRFFARFGPTSDPPPLLSTWLLINSFLRRGSPLWPDAAPASLLPFTARSLVECEDIVVCVTTLNKLVRSGALTRDRLLAHPGLASVLEAAIRRRWDVLDFTAPALLGVG